MSGRPNSGAIWPDAGDPPNADFTCTVDGEVINYVVELTMPELAGDELTYAVEGIGDSNLPVSGTTCSGSGHLFIDQHDGAPRLA